MNYVCITICTFWLALQFLTIVCTNLSIFFFSFVIVYTVKIAFQLPVILIFLSDIIFFGFFSQVCISYEYTKVIIQNTY